MKKTFYFIFAFFLLFNSNDANITKENLKLPDYCSKWCGKNMLPIAIVDMAENVCLTFHRGYKRSSDSNEIKLVSKSNLKGTPIPLFAAKAKTGLNVENAYYGMTDKLFMLQWGDYRQYYKSPLMENWYTMKFNRINFVLYKQGELQCSIQFNSANSNVVNWFHNSRIIRSHPWNVEVLKKQKKWLYFSIDGENAAHGLRPFAGIVLYNGCPGDIGIFMVLETKPADVCSKYFYLDNSNVTSRMIWSYNPTTGGPGLFANKQQTQEADEMRIEGIIDRDIFVYE